MLGVIPMNARYATWFRAGVVHSCGRQIGTRDQRAEHAHAADRFARKIVGFLALCAVRSRRLMGKPFGRRDRCFTTPLTVMTCYTHSQPVIPMSEKTE